jgi:hypothetical protein
MRKGLFPLVSMAIVSVFVTGCGGSGVTVPTIAPTATVNAAATSTRTAELAQLATAQAPTATPLPPTDTPVPPTATPAPTATSAPRATATRASASATPRSATPRPATAVSRAPLGIAPPGWKTYTGSARTPFAIYYPPDWKADESAATAAGQIKFQSPNPAVAFTMQVNTQKTTVSIDTLRDAQAKGIADTCKASGVEGTDRETYSGVIFDELIQTCDFGQPPLLVFGIAAGLNNGYPWTFFLSAPRDSIEDSVNTYFQPMLDSLNIYANPVG